MRREIAQLETVLNQRELAIEAAIIQPSIAEAIAGQEWDADVHFNYEESAWEVSFLDDDEKELIATKVNLNKKLARGRKARRKLAA